MVPDFPALPHDFGLGGDSFERFEVPAGVKEDSLIRAEKEEKLLVEAARFLLIGGQDHKGPWARRAIWERR